MSTPNSISVANEFKKLCNKIQQYLNISNEIESIDQIDGKLYVYYYQGTRYKREIINADAIDQMLKKC